MPTPKNVQKRPQVGPEIVVHCRMLRTQLAEIDRLAATQRRNRSQQLQVIIERGLAGLAS